MFFLRIKITRKLYNDSVVLEQKLNKEKFKNKSSQTDLSRDVSIGPIVPRHLNKVLSTCSSRGFGGEKVTSGHGLIFATFELFCTNA